MPGGAGHCSTLFIHIDDVTVGIEDDGMMSRTNVTRWFIALCAEVPWGQAAVVPIRSRRPQASRYLLIHGAGNQRDAAAVTELTRDGSVCGSDSCPEQIFVSSSLSWVGPGQAPMTHSHEIAAHEALSGRAVW